MMIPSNNEYKKTRYVCESALQQVQRKRIRFLNMKQKVKSHRFPTQEEAMATSKGITLEAIELNPMKLG